MKKIASVFALFFTVPAFATDITNLSNCNNNTLNTYSEPVDMSAKWTANTINLQWYDDEDDITPTTNTCVYDANISLPAQPSKPGYNFAGWQMRQCNLDGLADATGLHWSSHGYDFSKSKDICYSDSSTVNCGTTGLEMMEWKATFDFGTVRGVATCTGSEHAGTEVWQNNVYYIANGNILPADSLNSGEYNNNDKHNCWCKITDFSPANNTLCRVSSPSWVFFNGDYGDADYCAYSCAANCGVNFFTFPSFRMAVSGVTQ